MTVTVYHNPACGTSRNTLALLHHAGVEPEIIEYLKTPPSRERLVALITMAGMTVRSLLRKKGTPYAELGLDDPTLDDDALMDAMMAHPILINRPLVVTPNGVKLCRPSDVVLDLLPAGVLPGLNKEEGTPFLKDQPVAADDPAFVEALTAEGLPTDDLTESGRSFFTYSTLAGEVVGYGGYERAGADALLRSITVLPQARSQGIGRNLVALLMYRASQGGARTAWLLTTSAAPFFETIGFKAVERETAPSTILATRQATSLCPSSATLLTRSISF